jgi:hypothetical protein
MACGLYSVMASEPNRGSEAEDAARKLHFQQTIRPLLADRCLSCHGPDANHRQADLRLDLRGEAERAGAIRPGNPEGSSLVERMHSSDPDLVMPPPQSGKGLTSEERRLLEEWIEDGAVYADHWAFERPVRWELPDSKADHPIDAWIDRSLAPLGLQRSPEAMPETLVRRVSLDLVGLPPTLEQLDQFMVEYQRDPDLAYQHLVDRLLASPSYGEKWARWWLDQARYADSNGYSIDGPRSMWPYRDWVIRGFQNDVPFDQFTIEQIAGDLFREPTQAQVIATGFHRNTPINQEGGIDVEQFRIDSVFDRVATTGTVWLGLSLGCAQCHDHKFDPLTQREFYQVFSFFNNQDEPSIPVTTPGVDPDQIKRDIHTTESQLTSRLEASQQATQDWEAGLDDTARKALPEAIQKILGVESGKRNAVQKRQLYLHHSGEVDLEFQQLDKRLQELEQRRKEIPTTLVMKERKEPRATHLLIKGDFTRPAELVTPGTPGVLHPFNAVSQPSRLDLAHWIVDPANPLTARVLVNRFWQQFFGSGIVTTDNDFGVTGAFPTHPELLDWLAVSWQEEGWSVQRLHRLIVTSRTYRQSSVVREDSRQLDPLNQWWSRQNRLRLDSELVRDALLSASGQLSRKVGGPSVFPPIPDGILNQGQGKQSWKLSQGEDRFRRGLYTFCYRATPAPANSVFDAPDAASTCTRRLRSNTPLQALTLLNDPAHVELAEAMAGRIEREGLADAMRATISRSPDPWEISQLEGMDRWTQARILLNLDEAITRE